MTDDPAAPGPAAIDQAALIAECRKLLALGQRAQAATTAHLLEAARPATEAAWRPLHDLFVDLGSAVWAEIMTTRFLDAEPRHIPARLVRATQLSTLTNKHAETLHELDTLAAMDLKQAAELVQVALLYAKLQLHDRAMALFQTALAADPANVAIRAMLVHYCIQRREIARARAEITGIRALGQNSARTLATAATLAMRIDDRALAAEILSAALPLPAPDRNAALGTLIGIAAQLHHGSLPELLASSDLSQIRDVAQIIAIHTAIEGRGFTEPERRLVAHGLSLDPDNAAMVSAARRLQAPAARLFEPGQPRGGVTKAAKDRVRALMFWR